MNFLQNAAQNRIKAKLAYVREYLHRKWYNTREILFVFSSVRSANFSETTKLFTLNLVLDI
jgi:hypothetical protein